MRIKKHPFTVERMKLDDNGFFETDSQVQSLEELRCFYQELKQDMQNCFDRIRDEVQNRDNKRKKLLHKLKTCNLEYDYTSYVTGNSNIDEELAKIQNKLAVYQDRMSKFHHKADQIYEEKRRLLRAFFTDYKEIYDSLFIVNPNIYPKLTNYIKQPVTQNDNDTRKLELILTHVVSRAVTKTSPLAKLNRVAILENDSQKGYQITDRMINLNNVFLFQVYEQYVLSDGIITQIPFRLNRNYAVSEGDIYLFTHIQAKGNHKVYRAKDASYRMKCNVYIEKVIAKEGEVYWDCAKLMKLFGFGEEEAVKLIRQFYNIGLFVISDYFTDDFRMIQNCRKAMCRYKVPANSGGEKAIQLLEELEMKLEEINCSFQLDLVREIEEICNHIYDVMGMEHLLKPREFLFFDHLVEEPDETVDLSEWEKPLEKLISLYPLFDINLRTQEEMKSLMLMTYGKQEVSIKDGRLFSLVTQANLKYSGYWRGLYKRIESQNETICKLDDLKDSFIRYLRENVEENQVILTEEFLDGLIRDIPDCFKKREASYSFFYQLSDNFLVINKIYPGYQSFYGRFMRYTDIVERYGEQLRVFYKEDAFELAEINETIGFNANMYKPLFPTRVVMDLTRDQELNNEYEKVLNLDEALLCVDDDGFSIQDEEGRKYKPIVSTSLMRPLYPGKITFYSTLFSNINHFSDLACVYFTNIEEKKIYQSPRIVYKNLILERGRWLVPAGMMPVIHKESDTEVFEMLYDFLKEKELPLRFFFQVRKKEYNEDSVKMISMEFDKPQYFDLENMLLIKVLLNALKSAEWILISEVIPDKLSEPEYLTEFNLCRD